ncbi:MAG TPA: SpvB/TcaC N-terminal domain-containing protein [Nitrospira sp.]|nr:SpvB/TcaC N-terminal domain-containing protein [Nitrospira sp.]
MRLPSRLTCAFIVTAALIALVCSEPTVFAREVDENRPIGAVGGAVHGDPYTGTATMSVPIDVAPGRNSIQPSLALTYASTTGNGWVGVGWKLEMGSIERQTRFGVDYSKNDYSIQMSGISTDLVNASPPASSDQYVAKLEGAFLRIRKLSAGFEVTDKKGTKYLFGSSSASRISDPADSSKVFKWFLDRVEDRDGNFMTAAYAADSGQLYLEHIDYTGNGAVAPIHAVRFYLETRPDAPTMYGSGFPITTGKRLKSIEVKANGNLMRAYGLTYGQGPNSGRSQLNQVQEYGRDAVVNQVTGGLTPGSSALPPPLSLTWKGPANQFGSESLLWVEAGDHAPIRFGTGDINGDGKVDLLRWQARNGWAQADYALSTGTGYGPFVQYVAWGGPYDYSGYSFMLADFNADGAADMIVTRADGTRLSLDIALWTGSSFAASTNVFEKNGNYSNYQFSFGDINGDSKPDVMAWKAVNGEATASYALSTPTVYGPLNLYTSLSGPYNYSGHAFQLVDINGDSRADIVLTRADSTRLSAEYSIWNGTSFGAASSVFGDWNGDYSGYRFVFGDINADSRTDILVWKAVNNSAVVHYAINKASGFGPMVQHINWGSGFDYTGYGFQLLDVNSDGCADLVITRYHQTRLEAKYALSNGVTFGSIVQVIEEDGYYEHEQVFFIDINGDGMPDYARTRADAMEGHLWIAFETASTPDLLVNTQNGLGGATTITYTPSTQLGTTHTQLPYPVQIVAAITTCDNWAGGNCIGTSATTQYTYSGGYHHFVERDFRGFSYVKMTGPVGPNGEQAISETWFHQGNDVTANVNNPNVPNGYTKGLPYRTKITDSTGRVYSDSTTTYAADVDGVAPFFTPVAQVDASIDNGAKLTRTAYVQYDAYGNVLREDQMGDLSTTNDDRTVIRTFANNMTDWLIGFPTSETSYAGIGTTTQVAQTTLYYDGTTGCSVASMNQVPTKGHVTRTVRWLNGGTSPETRMAYDAFGNLTCTRDALGQTSTVTYDSTNTFAKTATNPLGHVVTTAYYGVDGVLMDKGLYGQVKSVTDPNNQTTTSEYDVLGRKSKTTTPDGLITTATYNYGIGFTVGTQHVLTSTSGAGLATTLTSATYFDGLGRTVKKETTGPDGKTIVTEVQYDSRGAVRKKSLPYFKTLESVTGRWATTSYDALGRVVRMDSPDGTRGLACFTDWVVVTIDAADHRKRETKDAYGRTIRVDEYQGTASTCDTSVGTPYATTTYQYDVQGNLLSVTDARGNISTMTYDTLNRKTAMHDPDMGNWSYVYDPNGNLTKQTDAKGQVLWFRYDALNRRVQKDFTTQKALGAGDVRYTYDGATNNRKGRLQQVVDASGTVVFQYDGLGHISQTDKTLDGTTYTTQSTYDGLGRLLTVTYPSTPSKTISYAYNGPVLDKVFEGTTTYIQYTNHNALGQAGTTTYGNGVSTTTTYANASNTVCSQQNFRLCTLVTNGPGSGGGGGGTSTTYSALADFFGTQGSRGWYYLSSTGTQLTWNGSYWTGTDGYLGLWNDGGHPGNSTDAVRRWVAPSAGSIQITGNTFDGDTSCGTDGVVVTIRKNGAVIWTQTIAAGNTTGFTFNLLNSVVVGDQIDFVINKLTTSSCDNTVFTPTIVLTTAGGGSGPLLNGTYTAPASTVNLSTEGTVDWTHWGLSTATSFNHKSGVTSQISNVSAVGGGVAGQYSDNLVGYTWTGGTPTASATNSTTGLYIVGVNKGFQFTVPADTTQRTLKVYVSAWGAQGKMEAFLSDGSAAGYSDTSLSDPGLSSSGAARVYTFTYRAASANQTLTIRWTNLVQNDPAGGNVTLQAATLVTTSGGGSGGTAYQDLRYVYGLNGNVSDIYDNLVAGGAGDQHLSYDGLDRLTLANGPYGTNGATASLTYTYDELGNLTFNSQVGTYAYPASGSTSVRPHAVTTAGSNSYSYDANGNLTTGAGRSLTYNLENKPLTVVISGQTTTFVYDGDGGRVKKIAGTTTTRYVSKLYECDNTSCSRMVFAGDQRIATIGASGSIYYYHTDHLGSSSVITDSAGAKVQAVTYFPYGATRTNNSTATPAIDVAYKYTGKELDSSTNLYYYEARYYDPTLGRFLTADTLIPDPKDPQSLNRYTYVRSNPFKYVDPTGHLFGIKININKFLKSALGDLGTTVLGVAFQAMGPLGWGGNFVLGGAILSQSKSGRYLIAGEMVIGTAIGAIACTAATAGGCAPIAGAAIGAASGAAFGGLSAAKNGGDLSSGLAFGATVGAVTGAIGGSIGAPGVLPKDTVLASFIFENPGTWLTAKIGEAFVTGFGSSLTSEFKGGKGQFGHMLNAALQAGLKDAAYSPLKGIGSEIPGQVFGEGSHIGNFGCMGSCELNEMKNASEVYGESSTQLRNSWKLFKELSVGLGAGIGLPELQNVVAR